MVTQLQQKKVALGKKLHILRILTTSKSKNEVGIIEDSILHIMALQLKIAAVRRQIAMRKSNLLQVVKVVKVEGRGYMVRVKCARRQGTLVAIVAALDQMGLVVRQARVSCSFGRFSMDALVSSSSSEHHQDGVDEELALDVKMVTHVVTNAVENQNFIT